MKSTGWAALYTRIIQISWTRRNSLSHSSKFHLLLLVPAMWHLSLTFSSLTQGSKGEINFLSLAQETVSSLFFFNILFVCVCRQGFWLTAHGDSISHKLFPVFQITSWAGASRSTAQPGGARGSWEPSTGSHQAGVKPAQNWLFILTDIFLLLFSLKEGHYFQVLYIHIFVSREFSQTNTPNVSLLVLLSANLILAFRG